MSFPTPTIVYTPSELSEAERVFWRSAPQMNVAVKSTETAASDAQDDADGAQAAADAAQLDATQALADVNTLDGDVVKLAGAQNVSGVKTLASFWEYGSIPATPSGTQIPRMIDVVTEANRNDNAWIAASVTAGWSGNVSFRKDRWGYLEVIFTITYSSGGNIFTTLPSGYRPDYFFNSGIKTGTSDVYVTLDTDGEIHLTGAGSTTGTISHYFKIKVNTPY